MNFQNQLLNIKRYTKFTSIQIKGKSQINNELIEKLIKNNILTKGIQKILSGIDYVRSIISRKRYDAQTETILKSIPSVLKQYALAGNEYAEFYRFNETENMELTFGSIENFLDRRGMKIKTYLENIGFKVNLKQDKNETQNYCAIRIYFEEQKRKN